MQGWVLASARIVMGHDKTRKKPDSLIIFVAIRFPVLAGQGIKYYSDTLAVHFCSYGTDKTNERLKMCFHELISKFIEDVLAGTFLLWIGFVFFKRQQKFLASAQEVKERCKDLEKFLIPFVDINLQYQFFDNSIKMNIRCNTSNFIERFLSRSQMENNISITVLKALPKPDNTGQPIPDSLTRTVELQEPLSILIHLKVVSWTARNFLLDTMEKLNNKEPAYDANTLLNIWNEYLKSRSDYSVTLKIFETVAHKSIHGAYDWDKFVDELTKIKRE